MKLFTSTTKAMLLALFAGVVFFCLYWTTLNDGFFPGEAARQVSIAMRMERGSSTTQFRQVEERYSRAAEGNVSISVRENVINYVTKESTMLDLITGGATKRETSVGELFTLETRFRTQSLFIQPFDYGYMCLLLLLVTIYGYTRGLVRRSRVWLTLLMSLFGVFTCGCRTVIYCFVFSALAYAFMYLKGKRVPIYVGLSIIAVTLLYNYSSFFRSKAEFALSIFGDRDSDIGGSDLESRSVQFLRVLYYLKDHYWLGRGYDFFWIDLQFSEGQQYSLDSELLGLEGVHLKYLLERGIIGYAMYLVF